MKVPFASFLLILFCWSTPLSLWAEKAEKDFLITLNGSKLTGTITDISISNQKSQISFENDFGDIYVIEASTIFGFVFNDDGETVLFESKCLNKRWQFLKVEKKGMELSLYTSVERQLQFASSGESPIVIEEKNPQIWMQFAGEQPFKVYRLNYKNVLRKRVGDYPDLANNIGKRGFRYKDLPQITELYNRFCQKKKG